MGGEATPPEPGSEKSRKKGLDLSVFIAPAVSVETTIGKVFLYPLRDSDITQVGKLTPNRPSTRLREFLPSIASLIETSRLKDERQPLAEDLVARLSDDEIEVVAEAYAASSSLEEGSPSAVSLARGDPRSRFSTASTSSVIFISLSGAKLIESMPKSTRNWAISG